ncbi:hypothetical protein LB521_27645 [Mesorhizobium sp. BR-1-1-8]|uniref:hypothetical protein n=1 Tax=Mesorhizobium sp. BR-1-1-8 TaxID=2876659 RepID=UPI001CCBA542|nr:hypothetical protein [Mesorhizobium sp. BR-1-1-8]MBZ9984911.1 hypothetical protein [Mesorhizobium sp. BR-1-1-8]
MSKWIIRKLSILAGVCVSAAVAWLAAEMLDLDFWHAFTINIALIAFGASYDLVEQS